MARKSNSEQRQAEIVTALLGTMAEHGYEKATIQLIAKAAGLAPGLLHYHFKTKADILLALVKMLADQSRQRYLALAEHAASGADKLAAYVQARLGLGEGADLKAVAAWVVIGAEAVRQPEVRTVYQDAVRAEMTLLQDLLAACLVDRRKSTASVAALAAAVLALMEGAFQLASAAPGVMPAGYAASTTLALIERYIDAEPTAGPR